MALVRVTPVGWPLLIVMVAFTNIYKVGSAAIFIDWCCSMAGVPD